MSVNAPDHQKRPGAGGAATNGGMSFQASVTVCACVRMLAGKDLGWLRDIYLGVPVAISPESGGPGDDLRIEYSDGVCVEAQVKKGLRADYRLWEALDPLASALHEGTLDYAVLVIDPGASKPIQHELAKDIATISRGQEVVGSGVIGRWEGRLVAQGICIKAICKRLSIEVIHATRADRVHIDYAKDMLGQLLAEGQSAQNAWYSLSDYVHSQIEARGRITNESLVKVLERDGFTLRTAPGSQKSHIAFRRWVEQRNSCFSLPVGNRTLPLNSLLPMRVCRHTRTTYRDESLESALKRYRAGAEEKRYSDQFAVDWLARFKRQAVIVAGPGQGKSMAMKVLATRYSADGYFVLAVRLKQLAIAMKQGATFKHALLGAALDSSPLSHEAFLSIDSSRWVLLADGLDECANEHSDMAREIQAFTLGHPNMRVVVTTRPIGYDTAELDTWAHYTIIPPASENGCSNLSKLMVAAAAGTRTHEACERLAELQLNQSPAAKAISTSPLLLVMSACLLLEDDELPQRRTDLYIRFLALYDKLPPGFDRNTKKLADSVLNLMGWQLREKPTIGPRDQLTEVCTAEISRCWEMTKWEAGREVEHALSLWESAGLIEVLNHNGQELLTFTHLSFAEFLAARHLQSQAQRLLAEVADKPEWQEVVSYAVEFGMAQDLATYYWARHEDGDPDALSHALTWAAKSEPVAQAADLQRLVQAALALLDASPPIPVTQRLEIGLALCGVAMMGSNFLERWLRTALHAVDAVTKLIAWAVACRSGLSLYQPLQIRATYGELLELHGRVVEPHEYFQNRHRPDGLLLQHVAMAALESCALEEIQAFSEALLGEERLYKAGDFQYKVSWVLFERGIRPHYETHNHRHAFGELFARAQGPSHETISRYRALSRRVTKLLADAFVQEKSCWAVEHRVLTEFPQFAGLLSVSDINRFNLDECFVEDWPEDPASLGALFKDFARALELDLAGLAWEAREVLRRLEAEPGFTLFDHLPDVDCEYANKLLKIRVGLKPAAAYLLNGPAGIQFIAGLLLLRAQMTEQDVQHLLYQASDRAVGLVCLLIEAHCADRAVDLLVEYLHRTPDQPVSGVLNSLHRLGASPEGGVDALVAGYLTSDCLQTVFSAVDLVQSWQAAKVFTQAQAVVLAEEHWRNQPSSLIHYDRDVHSELKLLLAGI
ncbi:NACHT domain-containing NTPase [Pseudomonas sp. F16(2018)]|uniref:NACHT domain-containing protein n=1 Tax=Pseudomonas sp. F16(2018) TaxID=2093746 RepID=UPI00111A3A4A|nr:hypothetical protein [Pseudomonas sp. F16(2018)]